MSMPLDAQCSISLGRVLGGAHYTKGCFQQIQTFDKLKSAKSKSQLQTKLLLLQNSKNIINCGVCDSSP